jgi:hypothetical protein
MRLVLNTLTTFLNYFGRRKVSSRPNRTRPHNIFAPRKPRLAGSRSARLHAARSAARLRKHRSIANAAGNNTNQSSSPAGTGTAHGAKQQGTECRRAKMRPLTGNKPLRRCNTVIVPQPPTYPQPPGAFVVEPSFIVPGFPELDYRDLPPVVELKLFFDALHEGRQTILRAEEERIAREEAEYARRLEQNSNGVQAAHRRAVATEYAKLVEENWRKAEAARRKAEQEEFARLLQENIRKTQEAQRRAREQEERRRQAERESIERKRREEERREKQRREEERREKQRREEERLEKQLREEERREKQRREEERREKVRREHAEAAQSNVIARLRVYEETWAKLRANDDKGIPLGFYDIPWPSFENVSSVGDITRERVLAFVSHPLRKRIQGHDEGLSKSLRLELLRWHPDKFESNTLPKVIGCDREAVREAATQVTGILVAFNNEMH